MKIRIYEWPIAFLGLLLWPAHRVMRSRLRRVLHRRPRLSEIYEAEGAQ